MYHLASYRTAIHSGCPVPACCFPGGPPCRLTAGCPARPHFVFSRPLIPAAGRAIVCNESMLQCDVVHGQGRAARGLPAAAGSRRAAAGAAHARAAAARRAACSMGPANSALRSRSLAPTCPQALRRSPVNSAAPLSTATSLRAPGDVLEAAHISPAMAGSRQGRGAPCVVLAGTASGVGKTALSTGLMAALRCVWGALGQRRSRGGGPGCAAAPRSHLAPARCSHGSRLAPPAAGAEGSRFRHSRRAQVRQGCGPPPPPAGAAAAVVLLSTCPCACACTTVLLLVVAARVTGCTFGMDSLRWRAGLKGLRARCARRLPGPDASRGGHGPPLHQPGHLDAHSGAGARLLECWWW